MDLASKEVLKQALQRFDGTMLVVSHDRDFLHGLTQIVYEIKPDRLRIWPGDVLDFLKEKKAETIAEFEQNKKEVSQKKEQAQKVEQVTAPTISREDAKEKEKAKKKLQTSIQKIEKDIESAEQTIAKMDVEMAALDYTNTEETNKKLADYAAEKAKLDGLFQEWEKVSAELASAEG